MELTLVMKFSKEQVVLSSMLYNKELLNLCRTLITLQVGEITGSLESTKGFSINSSKEEVISVEKTA